MLKRRALAGALLLGSLLLTACSSTDSSTTEGHEKVNVRSSFASTVQFSPGVGESKADLEGWLSPVRIDVRDRPWHWYEYQLLIPAASKVRVAPSRTILVSGPADSPQASMLASAVAGRNANVEAVRSPGSGLLRAVQITIVDIVSQEGTPTSTATQGAGGRDLSFRGVLADSDLAPSSLTAKALVIGIPTPQRSPELGPAEFQAVQVDATTVFDYKGERLVDKAATLTRMMGSSNTWVQVTARVNHDAVLATRISITRWGHARP